MSRQTYFKLFLALVLLIATVVFAALGNEAIYPSTMVGVFLVLSLLNTGDLAKSTDGLAAHRAIGTFAILVMLLNTAVSVFLPLVAPADIPFGGIELTTGIGTSDASAAGALIAVTINDMHELCYSTSVLLLVNSAYLLFMRRGHSRRSLTA